MKYTLLFFSFAISISTIAQVDLLGELENVTLNSESDGQYLRYNGTNFVNSAIQLNDLGSGVNNRIVVWSGDTLSSGPFEVVGSTSRFTQQTSVQWPTGATAFEGVPADGSGRYDSDTDKFRLRINGSWQNAASEDWVATQVTDNEPDVTYSEDTDLVFTPDVPVEHVTLNTTGSAGSDTDLSLPTAGPTYAGFKIIVWSIDSNVTHDNTISASIIQNGATTSGSISLNNFQSTTVSCILIDTSSYRWVVVNQY